MHSLKYICRKKMHLTVTYHEAIATRMELLFQIRCKLLVVQDSYSGAGGNKVGVMITEWKAKPTSSLCDVDIAKTIRRAINVGLA